MYEDPERRRAAKLTRPYDAVTMATRVSWVLGSSAGAVANDRKHLRRWTLGRPVITTASSKPSETPIMVLNGKLSSKANVPMRTYILQSAERRGLTDECEKPLENFAAGTKSACFITALFMPAWVIGPHE